MAETTPESPEFKISPEEVLLSAFEYLRKTSLTLNELLDFAAAMNSPSHDVTQAILANLVEQGKLEWKKVNGVVLFRKTTRPTTRIYLN